MKSRTLMRSLIRAPRIPELLFAAVIMWLFASSEGWTVLLADGDTGWHIRNGERILDTRSVSRTDPFAFGTAGHDWFAWEWLADLCFALLFRAAGLKAVAVFCGILIAASVAVLYRHMVWRSVEVSIALPLCLLSAGASSIHYLARPHAIGLLLFAIALWIIDRDRATPDWSVWTLPLLFVIWANCHGSFLAGLAVLVIWLLESLAGAGNGLRRPATVLILCTAATLCNPYGWNLHVHAIGFLSSTWIQSVIEEFQSPKFRSENMLQFEILLIAGLCAVPWLIRRRELYPAAMVLLWAHESLVSVRHVPLYCLAAGPFTGAWLQDGWNGIVRRSRTDCLFRVFESINQTWRRWNRGVTLWPCIFCLAITRAAFLPAGGAISFPCNKFPVKLIERNIGNLASAGMPNRVFSSDQWSDYLIFRLYPAVRVFFDGRSDFFGPWRGKDYQELMGGGSHSSAILARENVQFALIPKAWALSAILKSDPRWRIVDADEQALLFLHDGQRNSAHPNEKQRSNR